MLGPHEVMRMQATIRTQLAFLSALCMALCIGCATSPSSSNTTGLWKSSNEESEVPKTSSGELPPKETARACMVAAEELQNKGHTQQAILLYEKARRNDPSLKSVAHHLAILYDAQGDGTRALMEYNKALEIDPKNPNVLSDVGYYYYERQNYAEAEQSLRKALAIDPKHEKALSNLGLVLAEQGRFDESFTMFSKAVGPAAAHSNVGVLMAKQGHYDEARKLFQQAIAEDASLQQPKAFLAYLDAQQPQRL
jgi:Tfp pilus assembly protein PilF